MIAPWATPVVSAAVPDEPAIEGHGARRTHGGLRAGASAFAHALRELGIRPGDRVAIVVEDRVEAVEAYLGIGLAGATVLHVNDRLAPAEIDALLDLAPPAALVHTEGRSATAAALLALRPGLRVVSIGAPVEGALAFADLVGRPETDPPAVLVDPSSVAVMAFTSGTTGRPKAVPFDQATLARIIDLGAVNLRLGWRGRCAFIGTFSFPGGVYAVLLPHLRLGGSVFLISGSGVDTWLDVVRDHRITMTTMLSPLVREFTAAAQRRRQDLASLQTVLHSGSAIPPDDLAALVEVLDGRLLEAYGMTETGLPVTYTYPEDWTVAGADDVHRSAGRPIPLVDVAILDPADRPVPVGEPGEICVRSPTLFQGYRLADVDDGGATGFDADGWFHSGDIGRRDAAGFVYVTDRLKDMIVSGGMNVFPGEVEAALREHPDVDDVAVVGVPHPRWDETVAALVVRRPGAALAEADVVAHARARLGAYKKPTVVAFADELPRNANTKVLKDQVRRILIDATAGSTSA